MMRVGCVYYYGARYYAAWLGRFVSTDPMEAQNPGKTPYHYASNNPINMIDPTGGQQQENNSNNQKDKSNNEGKDQEMVKHKVESGDTLSEIAQEYDDVTWKEIKERNKEKIEPREQENQINAGETLDIKPKEESNADKGKKGDQGSDQPKLGKSITLNKDKLQHHPRGEKTRSNNQGSSLSFDMPGGVSIYNARGSGNTGGSKIWGGDLIYINFGKLTKLFSNLGSTQPRKKPGSKPNPQKQTSGTTKEQTSKALERGSEAAKEGGTDESEEKGMDKSGQEDETEETQLETRSAKEEEEDNRVQTTGFELEGQQYRSTTSESGKVRYYKGQVKPENRIKSDSLREKVAAKREKFLKQLR